MSVAEGSFNNSATCCLGGLRSKAWRFVAPIVSRESMETNVSQAWWGVLGWKVTTFWWTLIIKFIGKGDTEENGVWVCVTRSLSIVVTGSGVFDWWWIMLWRHGVFGYRADICSFWVARFPIGMVDSVFEALSKSMKAPLIEDRFEMITLLRLQLN